MALSKVPHEKRWQNVYSISEGNFFKKRINMKCKNCGFEEPQSEIEQSFDLFWKLYPRKTGKGLSLKIWKKLKPSLEQMSQIIEALEVQVKNPTWIENGIAIFPHPATWLRQERWLDETKKKDAPKYDVAKMEARKEELRQLADRDWERRNKA